VPPTCAHAVALDLADSAAVTAFAEGPLRAIAPDLLVNGAGAGAFGFLEELDAATVSAHLRLMLETPALLCRAALPTMLAQNKGTILNVSSLAAEFPLPCMAPYNAAKTGLSALSKSLMEETCGTGVAVIDFRPGDFRSGFVAATTRTGGDDAAWEAALTHEKNSPSAQDVAKVLFRAIASGKSGTVRSGGFFQCRVAPFGARFLPEAFFAHFSRIYLGGGRKKAGHR
jgi:short-subunit dehydrogenase